MSYIFKNLELQQESENMLKLEQEVIIKKDKLLDIIKDITDEKFLELVKGIAAMNLKKIARRKQKSEETEAERELRKIDEKAFMLP